MNRLVILFPVWAVVFSALAMFRPEWFSGSADIIVPLLALVMFGMGVSLTVDDFRRVLARPAVIALGVVLQFAMMPLLGWAIVRGLGLEAGLAAGVILVGACPGGTASNVICYLARADVALSITLTACSTLLAVVLTPLLTWFWAGQLVPVDVVGMFSSIARIVLIPVLLGVALNHVAGRRLTRLAQIFPVVSVAAIVWIIAIVVALNHARLAGVAALLVFAVALHNLSGLLCGYWAARACGFADRQARTLAIEVGMQNSGLAVALATQYFAPVAALPGAVFSVWHNLSGSVLAARWRGATR